MSVPEPPAEIVPIPTRPPYLCKIKLLFETAPASCACIHEYVSPDVAPKPMINLEPAAGEESKSEFTKENREKTDNWVSGSFIPIPTLPPLNTVNLAALFVTNCRGVEVLDPK